MPLTKATDKLILTRLTSSPENSLAADTPAAPSTAGIPLNSPQFGLIDVADPAGSDLETGNVTVYHDASSDGDLRIGGPDQSLFRVAPGTYITLDVSRLSAVCVANRSATDPAVFFVLVGYKE
jgi:hypothetical protein